MKVKNNSGKRKNFDSWPGLSAPSGERGEDFQSYLKRQAEEASNMAKETKLMAPKGTPWYTIISESSAKNVDDSNSTSTGTAAVSVQVVEKLS